MKSTTIRTSLRRKIFLRLTSLVGLALIATGSLSVFTTRSLIRESATEDLLFLALERSEAVENLLDQNRTMTRVLASEEEIEKSLEQSGSLSALRAFLQDKRELIPSIENLLVLNEEGIILAATDSDLEGKDLSFSDYVRRGSHGTYLEPFHLLEAKRTYAIASPVRAENGLLLGIMIAEFPMQEVHSLLSGEKKLGRTGAFFLFESNGHPVCINPRHHVLSSRGVIAGILQEQDSLSQKGENSELCSLAASGDQSILRARDANDRMVLAASNELKDIGIGIMAAVEEKEIFAPMQLLLAILIGTTCILFLLVTLIASRLSREIVLPIWKLRESLQRLNTGSFSHTQGVFTGDELEVLDDEVGQLAVRLKEAYISLEEKVQERTQELNTAHAKDEALLESIGEGILAIDLYGKVLATNRSAELLLQWDRSEIIGHHFLSFLHLTSRDGKPVAPSEHAVQRALTEKTVVQTVPSETTLCERKDGSSFPIALTATPFLLQMEMQGMVVTIRDITEEKRIDRMKSEFISLASHQLRTPMTAIGWYIELLQNERTNLTEDQKDYVGQIIGSHRRMVELVNSLLNVSRIELGHIKIDPKEMTIKEVIRVPLENLKTQIEQKELSLVERIPGITVSVDPDLVRMVLENILSNAVKYTPAKGTIEISVIADKEELQFAVQDTGLGIPRAQQGRIFEKLFRADNVLKADTEGTGIGLYIAKSTAEAWGGHLWFESAEGRGTRFFFTVPRRMEKVGEENGIQ